MNFFATLVHRPVGTTLLAIGLALAGVWAYLLLGVAAFPSIQFPGVAVFAQLPGASAQTMATTVVSPLERHLGRIPGIRQIVSNTSEGATQIMVLFNFGRTTDAAARDVQAAINAAAADLPPGLPGPPQYFKFDTSQVPVLIVSLTSTSLPPDRLYDLADTLLKPTVMQLPGVANVQVSGGTPHAVRVTLNTSALAHAGLTANDVANALRAANVTAPLGMLDNGVTQMAIATDTLKDAKQFARIIIAVRNDVPVRLSDVATVENGQQDKYAAAWFNGERAVTMQISKRPEANAVSTVAAIRAALPGLKALLPADVGIMPVFDLTPTTLSALHEVEIALVMSVVMVVLVMLVFLRRVRPTLIAMLSVPLSLAGALIVMWSLGFTLNLFSLIALVLCIGFVVDDAIVVIENIVRHMEHGEAPLPASIHGVGEIGFTVVSITLSLLAVFAPLVFGNNTFTVLMREFAVTLVATIVISAVVSLTVTPALCGRWLTDADSQSGAGGRLRAMAERFDHGLLRAYEHALDWSLRHRRLMRWQPLILLVLTAALAVAVVKTAGGGLMPKEDTGLLQGSIRADANISPTLLATRVRELGAVIQADPDVADVSMELGSGQSPQPGAVGNTANLFVDLKPLGTGPGTRHASAQAIVDRLGAYYKNGPDMAVTLTPVQFIQLGGGGGAAGQYSFQLDSTDGTPLQEPTLRLERVMRGMKEFRDVSSSFDSIGQQQLIDVDRSAAARLQVSMAAVDTALADAFGQTPVSIIYSDINQYRVVLAAQGADSVRPGTLLNTYVRSGSGKMVPLSAIATIRSRIAPVTVEHFNQLESAAINYNLAQGVTQADGLALVNQAMFAAQLPPGVVKRYSGDNQQLMEALTNSLIMLVAVIAAMYLVLGILYESLIHPLTIISTLPAAGAGAFLAMLVTQSQLTLMSVIAVLMLIGIVKKNAILMVDFALVGERERGLAPPAAIREAALVRFRPITMTTLVAMGAALPLAIGFGTGAEMRQPLGIAILGGLLVSQLLTLLSTPAIYLWQYDRRERKARKAERKRAAKIARAAGEAPAMGQS